MLEPFGPSLYSADGPTVPFFGFRYPTRMALARLSTGGVWVWSPIALTPELIGEHRSAPREWRATFLRRRLTRAAREKVLGWHAQRLLIAHGECAKSGASGIIRQALSWI